MTTTSTALTIRATPEQLAKIQGTADACRNAIALSGNDYERSLTLAAGMRQLRELITPEMMADLASLQGTAIGFKTDKDKEGGYKPEQLRDPFLEATVRGFLPMGNEFNVIAGNFYGAKAGFERKVRTFFGLTDFQESYHVQETTGGTAMVQAVASWKVNGKPGELNRMKRTVDGQPHDDRIAVRVNSGMGPDAIVGKAKRKMYAAIYDRLTGAVWATPEGEVEDAIEVEFSGPRVRRSTLFDTEPPKDAAALEVDQAPIIEEYDAALEVCLIAADVSDVARKAGADKRLTTGKQRVMVNCAARRKALATKA